MRAFLVLLMLTLLPLQFTAAATATAECCGHIAASQGSHTQHHRPEQTSADQAAGDSAGIVLGLDDHCGMCHANCSALVKSMAQTLAEPAGIERAEHRAQPILPPWPARPDRPKWFAPHGSGFDASA